MEYKCIMCNKLLSGRQKKFCSGRCKTANSNIIHQKYSTQKQRGIDRKKHILGMVGGGCSICGYKKNLAAIEFHHLDSTNKSFQLDLRMIGNSKYDKLLLEINKCVPICSNCHREEHNPDFAI